MQTQVSAVEELGRGVRREWLHGRRILILTVNVKDDSIREATDVWAQGVIDGIRDWPKGQVMLLMHDASQATFSAYIRHKIDQVDKATPAHLFGRTALVVPRGVIGRFISLSANSTARLFRGRIETKVFFDREAALAWLEELLS
ncbi:MAG: hypothetical protein K8I82_03245 [Anaerolineae bacterium]|nr:hypothetical protein [Anaerolineae bacterium]